MLNIEEYKNSSFFQSLKLTKNEVLFSEWETDDHLYIIEKGELVVEKSVHTKQGKFKTLSHISIGNIIGEQSLWEEWTKEVQIRAHVDTTLLKINAKKDFPKFISENPIAWYKLLTTIIQLWNTRLSKANREITANYEVNVAISKIKDFSQTTLYKLLIVFQWILEVDQIMYFEKNLVMDNYFKLKYNSLDQKSIKNQILKFNDDTFDIDQLQKENIKVCKHHRYAPLILWKVNYGYILIWRNKSSFDENEEKLLENTTQSLVWVIHQKKIIEDEKNKVYIKSI